MTILTRHRWLGLAKISGWSRRSCRTRVRLGPTWAEARVMTQSRQISALSAPLSPSSWLGTGEQQPRCTGRAHVSHRAWFWCGCFQTDTGSEQGLRLGKCRQGHGCSESTKLILLSFQGLMHSSGPVGRHRQLVLVLEGELYLIPFALLKGSSSNEYLYERFSLIAVPSIQSLNPSSKV